MQNILYFFFRYGHLILFVGLQIFAIHLLVTYNDHQRTIFLKSSGAVAGWLLEKSNAIVQYIRLPSTSRILSEENARLSSQLLAIENIYGSAQTRKDSNEEQQYTLVSGRLISNSISRLDNYFTLDIGKKDGVDKGMGVIQQDGVLGVIIDVTSRYSRGISLLHRDSRLSVLIQRNHFFGTLSWTGGNPKSAILNEVPKHADLIIGDDIITSGYSAIFPRGIKVGKISSFRLQEGSNFYEIEVELNNDISRADFVYVVTNLYREEQKSIEGQDQ